MNSRTHVRLIIVSAALCLAATTVFAQNPPAAPQGAGAAAPQQGRGATVGQIPIPQPCTPEQIAAAQAPAPAQAGGAAGRGRGGRGGGGVPCHMPDPREGLKPGKYDAGEAALNMKLVTTMRQPEGMYDPNSTNGRSLEYANSDLAFGMNGRLALQGNFHGLIFYNIEDSAKTSLQTIVSCPGGQGDVSIWGNLAFMSVESYGRLDCAAPTPNAGRGRGAAAPPAAGATPPAAGAANQPAQGAGRGTAPPDPDRMYGVRIFDISDPRKPRQVAGVQTCRGSHTHSIVTDPNDKENIYIYVSGNSSIRSPEEKAGCVADPNAPNTSSFGIDVIKVPLKNPEQAAVVSHAYIFADANTGQIASLHGRRQGTGEPSPNPTAGCHDVTSFPFHQLLGGACSGNGLLLDTKTVTKPKRLDDVADPAFAFWHSVTFNNDATKMLFSDEWGGGTQPMCQSIHPTMWGGNAVFDIQGTGDGRHLRFGGYFKMPAWQTASENCVAHNGSLVPVPGRDIMAQAFYQGGATVFDFTDSARIQEIAYFDRGPIDANNLIIGGYWSVYYYNGYLYGSEIARGLDIFELTPSEYLSQNEIDAAKLATREGCGAPNDLNVQCQPHYVWPASFVVARAYLDQLARDKALPQERIDALNAAMKDVENASAANRRAAVTRLDGLAAELAKDAATAMGNTAARMRACASTIQKRNAQLR
ncbi:MAG TPA: hypothetical protein VES67_19645 [Vicinamibacterales bacterium]|nr:hypothetical protein [Vicinamibacterales bacterium]